MYATPGLPQALRVLTSITETLEAQGITVDSIQATRFGNGSVQVHDPEHLRAARDALQEVFTETAPPRIRGDYSNPSLSFTGVIQGLKLDLYGSLGTLGEPEGRHVHPSHPARAGQASSTPAQ